MRKLIDKVYDWMLRKLPFKWMYRKVYIDGCSMMWIPRWGWSKRQLKKAGIKASELMKKIKWD